MFGKILLILCLCSLSVFTQEKYFVYFKDKGISVNDALSKTSGHYIQAKNLLTEKCIERRLKSVSENELIGYEDLPVNEKYIEDIQAYGVKISHRLKWFNAVSCYLTENQIKAVEQLDFVDKVERVKKTIIKKQPEFLNVTTDLDKSNSTHSLNYGASLTQLELSSVPSMHDKGIDGSGVIIGLLDSGFDWKNHEAFRNSNVIAEHDFVRNDDNTADEPGDTKGQENHGTYVFGIIGGFMEGQLVGPAYNARFLLAKTEDIGSETTVEEDNYAAALEWMENYGVDVTTSSLGYSDLDTNPYSYSDMDGKTTIITKAADLAFKRGVVVVNSAGNEGNKTFKYITAPADGFNVIAVGAVTKDNVVASFSGRGPSYDGRIKPDVLAQGLSVVGATANTTDGYHTSQGTSSAAPIVGGIAGLILSTYPFLPNTEVRNLMLQASDNFNEPNNDRGYGLLSAEKAISFYYPVVELLNSKYQIRKTLYSDVIINQSTVKINISVNGKEFEPYELTLTSGKEYLLSNINYNQGDLLYFYFTYNDISGKTYTDPSPNKFYNLNVGNSLISVKRMVDIFPTDYSLEQNFPNPFNLSTKIRFYTKDYEKAEVTVYDVLGQKVKIVFNGFTDAGQNTVTWNGDNNEGNICSSGIYFCNLRIAGRNLSKKMLILK
ncbi:MAG: T9SS C-terminal target domain-containing protein [Ignavibacteriales bacterium]|nr:MAG: T9SS C-terminal target domain-containing protein [Ignavibacteriales bacterium]